MIFMTAFTTAQLPTGARAIATVEELVVWGTQILVANNPTKKFVRTSGQPSENRATFSEGVDADNVIRNQCVAILEYDTTKFGTSLPDWKQVKEMDTAVIPTSMQG